MKSRLPHTPTSIILTDGSRTSLGTKAGLQTSPSEVLMLCSMLRVTSELNLD